MFEAFSELLPPQHRILWADYCRFVRIGQAYFTDPQKTARLKSEQIKLLEKAVRKDFPLTKSLLSRLQKAFVRENLTLYLLLEPLQVWQWLAADKSSITEMQISEIASRLASPAARMLMVLNNETPSTYLPLTSLLSAHLLFTALQTKSQLLKSAKKSQRFWLKKLQGLTDNAAVVLSVLKSKRLKFLLALQLNRMRLQIDRLQNNKQHQSEWLDRMRIFLYSVYQFITVKRRTTETKGI